MFFTSLFVVLLLDWLGDNFHQVLLQLLLLEHEPVLVPNEVRHLGVPTILLHATLKESQNILIVWILSELELSAIVHEILEFLWVAFAEFIDSDLKLLLFDVVVLLVLGSAWESLPWETASQEVKKNVADGL